MNGKSFTIISIYHVGTSLTKKQSGLKTNSFFGSYGKGTIRVGVLCCVCEKQLQNVGEPEISGTEQECGAEEIQTGSPGSRGKHKGKTGQ